MINQKKLKKTVRKGTVGEEYSQRSNDVVNINLGLKYAH
jgi:hypothetical protein